MIRAVEVLVQEHRIINAVLDCLECFVKNSERDQRLDAVMAHKMVSFFREFADLCHHSKEEDLLFVRASAKTGDLGPVNVLKEEHCEGRTYVGEMQQAIEIAGRPQSLQRFGQNARDFIDMMRRHIEREDEVVFPLIEELISADEERDLWRDFQDVESKAGGNRHERLIAVAQELCERLNIAFPEHHINELLNNDSTMNPIVCNALGINGQDQELTSTLCAQSEQSLLAEGWERRYLADPRMAREAEENYQSLGYEVKLQPLDSASIPEQCEGCMAVLQKFVVVYTRKRP